MVVSGEQITMRSTWVSNRGESPPQTKVTLKQLFGPPSRGGAQGVRSVSGRRLGPQVAVSEGGVQPVRNVRNVSGRRLGPQVAVSEGGRQRVEAGGGRRRRGGAHEKKNLHTG